MMNFQHLRDYWYYKKLLYKLENGSDIIRHASQMKRFIIVSLLAMAKRFEVVDEKQLSV